MIRKKEELVASSLLALSLKLTGSEFLFFFFLFSTLARYTRRIKRRSFVAGNSRSSRRLRVGFGVCKLAGGLFTPVHLVVASRCTDAHMWTPSTFDAWPSFIPRLSFITRYDFPPRDHFFSPFLLASTEH